MGQAERDWPRWYEGAVELRFTRGGRTRTDEAASEQMNIRTFPDAVKEAVLWPLIKGMQITQTGPFKPSPINILHEFDGCLKPGEMCLVLGRPGSGCVR